MALWQSSINYTDTSYNRKSFLPKRRIKLIKLWNQTFLTKLLYSVIIGHQARLFRIDFKAINLV